MAEKRDAADERRRTTRRTVLGSALGGSTALLGAGTFGTRPGTARETADRSPTEERTDIGLSKTQTVHDGPKELWRRTYGGLDDERVRDLIRTSDGGYVLVGNTRSHGEAIANAWMVKTDPGGRELWTRTFGWGTINSVVQTTDGGYAIAGGISGAESELWIARTDAAGSLEWSRTYGGDGTLFSIAQTVDGGFAAGGFDRPRASILKVDRRGNAVGEYSRSDMVSVSDLVVSADGGVAFVGTHVGTVLDGRQDAMLGKCKFHSERVTEEFLTSFGTSNARENASSIVSAHDDGFVFVGLVSQSGETFHTRVVKTCPIGRSEWTVTLPDRAWKSIEPTFDGGYVLTGPHLGLVKIDGSGDREWTAQFDRGYRAQSAIQTRDGGYALGGTGCGGDGNREFLLIRTYPWTSMDE
ncbi:hypothetical protein [Natrinema halophilum]|uniref:Uncharacterized protein n=1 Tax=Natrinema halophilum TaxID=1699371 RepID=A0A7D5GM87_9EURY|nr:hypothetical protein [Natrinema halophilum]QLG48313.1 hypothetical protein HYG82_05340 [Natrinema halophilum]